MKPIFEVPVLLNLDGNPFEGELNEGALGSGCGMGCAGGCCSGCEPGRGNGVPLPPKE